MTPDNVTPGITPSGRTAVLLAVLEPLVPRERLEAALVLLGCRATGLREALDRGLLVQRGGRLDPVDSQLTRRVAQQVPDRARRSAHLALACAGRGPGTSPMSRELFDRLGTAVHTGSAPAGPAPAGPVPREPLTRQEQQVAALAATGARTREIAAAAYLSPKTVECHLTRVYRKLGIRSKAELASTFRTA